MKEKMTEKMKASVLIKPGVLEVQEVEIPDIGEEEVFSKRSLTRGSAAQMCPAQT